MRDMDKLAGQEIPGNLSIKGYERYGRRERIFKWNAKLCRNDVV